MTSLAALRSGDERAFATLVDELSGPMLRMARPYAGSAAGAEEVVQEAWLAVLGGLDGFEERSSLQTWILGVTLNVARGRARREARSVPFSALGDLGPERFLPADHPDWPGHWAIAPAPWPEAALESAETTALLRDAIAALPDAQRDVITLRDLVGCTAAEVAAALDISEGNQRVLLHRARTRVRATIEAALGATESLT